MDLIRFFSKNEAQFYAILRILAGFLFLWHGSQKLFNFPPSSFHSGGALPTQMLLAGIIEFVGGIQIMFGILTRYAALLCCIVMMIAYLTVHSPRAFLPMVNQGESALFYFFLFLYFLIRGSGIWSIDSVFKKIIPIQRNLDDRDIPVR